MYIHICTNSVYRSAQVNPSVDNEVFVYDKKHQKHTDREEVLRQTDDVGRNGLPIYLGASITNGN